MQILKDELHPDSVLHDDSTYTYADAFSCTVYATERLQPEKLGKAFFTCAPSWVDHLFNLRNKLVGWLGLKTSISIEERDILLASFTCEPGQQLGLFKVYEKRNNEVILGEDDKHLDFRISIFNAQQDENTQKISLATAVRFNNRFGKVYFFLIRPFHRFIVPVMLRRMIQQLQQTEGIHSKNTRI